MLVSMPTVIEEKPEVEILNSYLTKNVETIAFGPLMQYGFSINDFKINPDKPELRLFYEMENKRAVANFEIVKDVTIGGKKFKSGTIFKVMTSWKPTKKEFVNALEKDFEILNMFENREMSIALIGRKDL